MTDTEILDCLIEINTTMPTRDGYSDAAYYSQKGYFERLEHTKDFIISERNKENNK